jgi:hypothetical protein
LPGGIKKDHLRWALVAHTCNPSYSGGRDQEDCVLRPAWANSSARPYLKKLFTKIGLVEWLKVKALSLSPSTVKQEEERKERKSPNFGVCPNCFHDMKSCAC